MLDDPPPTGQRQAARATHTHCIGCVSYLNARPLIEGLDERDDLSVRFDVPSRLLEDLHARRVAIALCPIIDFYTSEQPLTIVPAGGIGCAGETLTVRIFSKTPIAGIAEIHADTDSHPSVALMRILLAERFDIRPRIIPYHAREHVAQHRLVDRPEAMLLIGDKVVTDSPRAVEYPHQLGQAWAEWTGLPLVFAVWMALRDTSPTVLAELDRELDAQRRCNASRIADIAARRAGMHGWPVDLAQRYLGELLQYSIGQQQVAAIERFGALAQAHHLIPAARPVTLSHPLAT